MTAALALAGLFGLLFAGVPIAFALGGLGLVMLLLGGFSPLMAPQALYSSIDNFILLAVPLFLLMSNILLKGGVGRDLFAAVQSWVGHLPGGLAVATVVSCAIFAAISGSSVACAATIGTVAIPEMISRGYQRHFVLGLLAAGGTLGILIPPSIPMIVYGVITEESIIDLFLAGIGPGLMLSGFFIVFSMIYARLSPASTPTFALATLILGGIYGGVFTPTEAAGVGFLAALTLTAGLLRRLTRADLEEAVFDAMKTTVTIFLIIAGAKIFGKAITLYRIPQDISSLIVTTVDERVFFVLIVCAMLLVMGLVLEALSMMLIMVPVLSPALSALAIDPIWFGVLFVIMVECALITPPVGLNLYVIQAVGKARMGEVTAGVWPFILLMLGSVALIYAFPALALYIPFQL
jgi:C4-dicarboxylate transporter DctM subunit